MDKFLEKYNFPRLNQQKIDPMNRSVISTKIEMGIKIFQQAKVQGHVASKVNSIKYLEKKLASLVLKLIQKIFQRQNNPKLIL